MNFIFEVWGENGVGKTHQSFNNFPNPVHIDTAFTEMGFRELNVEVNDDREGESWPVILKSHDWDEEAAREPYEYATTYGEIMDAIEDHEGDKDTIIIDNSSDLRTLAAKHWCRQNNSDWPKQEQWGEVNDMVNEVFERAKNNCHVVVISQMTDEYDDGEKTGERVWNGPKEMDYKADFRIKLVIEDGERSAKIKKNRFRDRAGENWVDSVGEEIDFEDLMLVSGIPEEHW